MKQKQNLKAIFIVIITIITVQIETYSQWKPKTLNVAFVSESISIPFSQIVTNPAHPGVSIGADLMVKDQTSWHKSFGVETGYYYHRLYEHAIMLDAVYNLGYTFGFKLQANLIGMIGYKYSILAGDTYKFENGEYRAKQHPGKPQFNTKIGLGLSYPISDEITITADYLGMMATPYSPDKGMPFALHALPRIGIKIKL